MAQAAGRAAPTIATAALATATGFLDPAAVAGADGPGLRAAAGGRDRGRAGLRADRRLGRAGAQRARGGHARRLAARRLRDASAPLRGPGGAGRGLARGPGAAVGAGRRAAGAVSARPRGTRDRLAPHSLGRRARPRPGPRAGQPRARGGDRRGDPQPGRVLADRPAVLALAGWIADTQTARPVRRDQARAVEHARAARPAHAGEGDRRVGRDRRHRPRAGRRHAAARCGG